MCFNETVLTAIADSAGVSAGAILGGRAAISAYLVLVLEVAHFIARDSCMTAVSGLLGPAGFATQTVNPSNPEPMQRAAAVRAAPPGPRPMSACCS